MLTKPVKASCSIGRALVKLSEEDIPKALGALNNPKVSGVQICKYLTLMTDEIVRERNMQRHRTYACACEYSE